MKSLKTLTQLPRFSYLCFTLLMLCAFPTWAQDGAPSASAFAEVVDVRVINLEVVVTQGKNRVEGLNSEDFRVLVNGEEMPIEYFTEVRDGYSVASDTRDMDSSLPALPPGEAVGTQSMGFSNSSTMVPPL